MKNLIFFLFASLLFIRCSSSGKLNNGDRTSSLNSIDSILFKEANIPAVIGKPGNLLTEVIVYANKSIALKRIKLSLKGTSDISDLKKIAVYFTGSSGVFKSESPFSISVNPKAEMVLPGNLLLEKGINYLWITADVKSGADLMHKVFSDCKEFQFENKLTIKPKYFPSLEGTRFGLALRSHGEEKINTYRIPGLTTTNYGTLIAVYDMRHNSDVDLQANIDIGMSRSTDGGRTWDPMKVIMDMGTFGGLPENQNGVGDPSVLVDKQTNTIWVAAVWAHGHPGKRNWTESKPGMSSDVTSQLMLVKSEDDGKSWSKPIDITPQVKKAEWYLLLQGPGKGITMEDGTLVFPAQFKDSGQMPYSTIIYSKDHGRTWKIGAGAKSNTTEAQVVELKPGTLMLNMHDNRGGSRSVFTTDDLGASWIEHPTSRSALVEPVCMASLISFHFKNERGNYKRILLFSNPNTVKGRHDITLKVSLDNGNTWPEKYYTLLDAGYSRGYSCLTQIDDHRVGILYESSVADLLFQIIDLRKIIKE